MYTQSDETLMAGILERDARAFEALFDRYAEALHRHVCFMLHDEAAAHDIVQEALRRAEELFACVAGARQGFAEVTREWERLGASFRERNVSRSFNVLTRALRARHPGLVFASAAAAGEVDLLADVESRLLVGLPV